MAGATTPQARTRHELAVAPPHILSLIAATTLGVLPAAPKGQSGVGETLLVVGSSALGSRNAASMRLATMRLSPACPCRAAIEHPFLASAKNLLACPSFSCEASVREGLGTGWLFRESSTGDSTGFSTGLFTGLCSGFFLGGGEPDPSQRPSSWRGGQRTDP